MSNLSGFRKNIPKEAGGNTAVELFELAQLQAAGDCQTETCSGDAELEAPKAGPANGRMSANRQRQQD